MKSSPNQTFALERVFTEREKESSVISGNISNNVSCSSEVFFFKFSASFIYFREF